MGEVLFKDYSDDVKKKIQQLGVAWLHEASGEIKSQTQRNTRVAFIDGGATKSSWRNVVDERKLEAQIGSRMENAIWEEFGTGIYALNGDGRKDVPWTYRSEKDGKFYKTKGKKPSRAFHHAYQTMKPRVIRSAQDKFRSMK